MRPHAAAVALACAAGCLPAGYAPGRFHGPAAPLPPCEVVMGEPDPTLDRVKSALRPPAVLPNLGPPRPGRDLTPEAADQLGQYLAANDLGDVRVEIGHYDPAAQWRALRLNTRIPAVWRYPAGAVSVVGYTLLPDRVFGGTRYNPFTDTLSVNGGDPLALLHAAAAAKGVRAARWPGPYVVATALPGLAAVRSAEAAAEVAAYAKSESDWGTERRAYRELYPRAAADGATGFGPAVAVTGAAAWVTPLVGIGGMGIGRGVGYLAERRRLAEMASTRTVGE